MSCLQWQKDELRTICIVCEWEKHERRQDCAQHESALLLTFYSLNCGACHGPACSSVAINWNLCSMVEQVAMLQHHGRRFAAADGLAMYLAICMPSKGSNELHESPGLHLPFPFVHLQLAEMYNEGGLVSGPMTASKKVHELSDALIEAFLGTWLEERAVFEHWLAEACTHAGGLVHISWAQPSLPTPVRCYLMGQLELKLLESRRSKPTS
eukprot:scaffold99134_cov16-Tisochrysis_lutea.AAC.1